MELQEDILTDLQDDTIWYQDASAGTRLLNFIIDVIMVIIIVVATEVFFFPELYENSVGQRVLSYTLFLVYYALFETATKGRTVGKLITGTKAIRQDGNEFSGGDAVLRSLCRLVPFDAFSTLGGSPWHDRWTKTRVVKVSK